MTTGIKFFGLVAVVTALVACGGGGGGSTTPAPVQGGGSTPVVPAPAPAAITGSITSVAEASIAFGQGTGESTIVWTSNATLPNEVSVRINGVVVSGQPTSPAGGQKVAVGAGEVKVELVNASGQVLDTKTAQTSCVLGQWQNGLCDRFSFRQLDVVILPLTPEQFWALKDGQAIPFVNKTGYTPKLGAAIPLGNCVLFDTLREDGAPLFSCTTIETGNQRRTFPVNPLTLEILPEYVGPIPTGARMIDTTYGTYGDTPYHQYDVSNLGMYADVAGYGVYYFTNFDDKRIRLTRDGFKTFTVVKEVEGIRVFYSFSSL